MLMGKIALTKCGAVMGPYGEWADMQTDTNLRKYLPTCPKEKMREPGKTKTPPALLAGLILHGWGGCHAHLFQLWVGTLTEYPQNIGFGKPPYKIELTGPLSKRKLPNYNKGSFSDIHISVVLVLGSPAPAEPWTDDKGECRCIFIFWCPCSLYEAPMTTV